MNTRRHLFSIVSVLALAAVALCGFVAGCASTANPGSVTTTQQTIANAVEDSVSIGLVPVLTKNPSYVAAAQTVAAALGTFTGDTITPADVDAFLSKVPQLTETDRQTVAGVVNAAWGVYVKRYAQQVNANVRPDVKLFLSALANGISSAATAVPQTHNP